MRLQIVQLPGCPGAAVLETRLAPLLADRPDIVLTRQVVTTQADAERRGMPRSPPPPRQVVTTQADAERRGMTGSPTLLADGVDPFALAGQLPSVSCRLYLDEYGQPGPAPSSRQLRDALQGRRSRFEEALERE